MRDVLEHVQGAAAQLDDLEENLSVFDLKLRHMREDIAAIEARNNRLELQTRNNSKLLTVLEGALAGRVPVMSPPECEKRT